MKATQPRLFRFKFADAGGSHTSSPRIGAYLHTNYKNQAVSQNPLPRAYA
ncbi:MAG: hypothetical protein H7A51_06595 [Akkermansiaceae bacterium]|nr:hypothetical protein [Akkermansiaceae bacterium]